MTSKEEERTMAIAERVIRSVHSYQDSPKPSPFNARALITLYETVDQVLLSPREAENVRREAEYLARRSGVKQPLLQVWK